jgi:glycosyl transferase family 2
MSEPKVREISIQEARVLIVIPTIKGREDLLRRAIKSIREPDLLVAGAIEVDTEGNGPAYTRNLGVLNTLNAGADPEFIAFLDDDDEFDQEHITRLVAHADATGADVVYPWFHLNVGGRIDNSRDPLLMNGAPAFGQEFDPTALEANNFIPVTALVRTSMFVAVGGFPQPNSEEWPHPDCEDWGLWKRLLALGARFSHLPERTWTWHWHGKNTSGRPDRAATIYGGKK